MSALFTDWRRPTFITSLNPGLLGYDRLLADLHPRIELVEIRLDGAWAALGAFMGKDEDFARAKSIISQAREQSGRPVLATFRTENEPGSQIQITDEAYEQLMLCMGKVADYVDLELNYPLMNTDAQTAAALTANPRAQEDLDKRVAKTVGQLQRDGAKVILSRHFWQPSPDSVEEVLDVLRHQVALGADVAKVAYSPADAAQLAALQEAGRYAFEIIHKPTMLIGMGEIGRPTRLAGPQAGNWGTFVTVGAPASAPGQLPLAELELRYPTVA